MSYVRRFTPRPAAQVRLVCLPHAGGTAASFRPWCPLLPAEIELIAIQYPGRHDRLADPFVAELTELAAEIGDELPRDLPLVYLGHSLGALLGYELAGLLEPRELIMSAPPSSRSHRVYADDRELLAAVRALGGSGAELLEHRVIQEMALPSIRHDFGMLARYRRTGPGDHLLACPLTMMVGGDDPVCTAAEAEGWRAHSAGPFEVRAFPGGHHYLEQQQDAVLAFLADRLEVPGAAGTDRRPGSVQAVD